MGQCTSTNGDDMVGPAGVACQRAMHVPHPKPADGQRRSGSSSNARRAAATGVEHHPSSRNAPVALAPAVGGGGSGNGGVVAPLQRAGASLSSEANSKHVQRLLASLSLLQALPSLYPWYIAQPALQPSLLSVCQARWQSIRLGAHELYAQVRSADPASSPTLVFFQLFSDDLLRRCPELHVHLFGSAPLTPRTKPSLSAKLCSLVQTTIASFAFQSTTTRRKRGTTSANKRPSSGLTSFDSVSECSELEPSTSASANPYHTAAPEPAPAASAAERKQRMASLWRQFNNAGINCEALGPFFTSLQNALATCFGVTEWRGTTAMAWNTLCSTVIEQLIGVESTGAGAPTLISAPASNANGDKSTGGGASQHLSVMDKSEGPLSLMSSPRSHTSGSQMGDTTDTVSRTGHTGSQVYAPSSQHSHKPSASALGLKPSAYKQRLDLASTASRVSRSGYTQSSDAYSPRRSPTNKQLQLTLPSSQLPQSALPPSQSQQLQQQLQMSQGAANALSLSMASPFSQSNASVSQSATPVRRMPSALAAAAGTNAPGNSQGMQGHGSVQSMSLGLSPLIQLPGQTPSPTTPAQAAAPAPGNSRPGTSDGFDDCECGAPDCKRCAEADAAVDDDSGSSGEPMDADTLRAIRETAALDPAQELARFAFHPKPPAKPKVVYMSGLELPPALLAADPATAALVAAADRRAAVYGRSLFGLSRVQPSAQAMASAGDMTALALLTNSSASASRSVAHSHNHTLSRNHSHARSGHSNSRSHAPVSALAPSSSSTVVSGPTVHLPMLPATSSSQSPVSPVSPSDMPTSSNLSLVSRAATNVVSNARPVVSVSA